MTIRDVLRGLGDTFENLLPFTIFSLCWWLSVVLVIPAPGATIALLVATDPRLVHTTSRPGIREAIQNTGQYLIRGWLLLLISAPLLGVAAFNLWSYRNERGMLAALIPLWFALLLIVMAVAAVALSCMALFDDGVMAGIRRAGMIVVKRALPVVLVLTLLWGLFLLCTALVVPMFMFFPAMAGAIVNRFVLRTLGIAIPEPLRPTPERRAEEEREQTARRFGP